MMDGPSGTTHPRQEFQPKTPLKQDSRKTFTYLGVPSAGVENSRLWLLDGVLFPRQSLCWASRAPGSFAVAFASFLGRRHAGSTLPLAFLCALSAMDGSCWPSPSAPEVRKRRQRRKKFWPQLSRRPGNAQSCGQCEITLAPRILQHNLLSHCGRAERATLHARVPRFRTHWLHWLCWLAGYFSLQLSGSWVVDRGGEGVGPERRAEST